MNEKEFDRLLEHVMNEEVLPCESLIIETKQLVKKPLRSAVELASVILLSLIIVVVTAFFTFPETTSIVSLLCWFSGVTILMNGLTAVILIRLSPLADFFVSFENSFYQE